jgi:POT family proton-dependent oligopeptide transporter
LFAPIVAGIVGTLFAQVYENQMSSAAVSAIGSSALDPLGSTFTGVAALSTIKETASRNGYLTVFLIAGFGMVIGEVIFLVFRSRVVTVQTATASTAAAASLPADLQRRRNIALVIFFAINVLFWMAFKQRANSMALWIENRTDRAAPDWLVSFLTAVHLDKLMLKNGLIAKELYQALNPLYVIILSPILVWFWNTLRAVRIEVPTPAKLVLGFVSTAGAFAIMWQVASSLSFDSRASSLVIVAFYAALTLGELCLSPMGLSLVSKLAAAKTRAVWMGMFFVSTSVGGYFSGEIYQLMKDWPWDQFFKVVTYSSLGGMALMLAAYPIIASALRGTPKK